jgi:quercetin dioxygenase-like cupin family protein
MQIFRFDRRVADNITPYDSHAIGFVRVLRSIQDANIAVMHIDAGGVVGYHQAVGEQLFMVVQGAGWVTGTDRVHVPVEPGRAAFWIDGEWHESGSDTGMAAVLIEAAALDPAKFLQLFVSP